MSQICGLRNGVHSIRNLPPLIDVEINFNKSRNNLINTVYEFGFYVLLKVKGKLKGIC